MNGVQLCTIVRNTGCVRIGCVCGPGNETHDWWNSFIFYKFSMFIILSLHIFLISNYIFRTLHIFKLCTFQIFISNITFVLCAPNIIGIEGLKV